MPFYDGVIRPQFAKNKEFEMPICMPIKDMKHTASFAKKMKMPKGQLQLRAMDMMFLLL